MKKITSKNLTKKLAQYGALAAAIGTMAEADGQVMYTDITDFQGDSMSSFDLDLNGDSTIDFTINGSSIQLLVDASSNALAGSVGSLSYLYPFALDNGTLVDGNQSWQSGGGQILRYKPSAAGSSCLYSSNWCGDQVDKFLGLRFMVNGNTHYGWARLDVTVTNSMDNWVVKDFAYEATPDTGIIAGDGILSVVDAEMQNIEIFSSNKQINLNKIPQESSYRIFNLSGQLILDGNINERSHSIDASSQASGVYIIEVSNTNSNIATTKKLVLSN